MPRFSYGLAYAGISSLDSAPSAGGGDSIVTPPAATSQAVAAGGSLAAVTFGAFTDADGVIDNYLVAVQNSAGSAAVSGSGLGAYTFGSTADGNAGVVTLTARNAANQPLATAVHTFSIAAAVGGLVSLLDWSSVTYDFLSTGGTSGSGGAGAHTVGGLSVDLDLRSTSGPTVLRLVSGVLEYEGSMTARGQLMVDLGVDVSLFSFTVVCSVENATRPTGTSTAILYVGENTGHNSGDQAQFMFGNSSDTKLMMRENHGSATAFTTLENATVTDITSTPTRVCCQMLGGAWQPSYDQGTAALPTNGAPLANRAGSNMQQFGSNFAKTAENRKYVGLNLIDNCDVRIAAFRGNT